MPKRIVTLIVAVFLLTYILPLGVRPLFVPDEVRYAEIPREMLATGDWVVPRIAGLRYFEKPVLGYWLTAASLALFGENNFAVRFPSALAAAGTALAVFLLVRKFGGGGMPAAVAAAVLLSCAMFFAVGTIAVLDMPLTMFLTAGMAFLYCAYAEGGVGGKVRYLALFGLCAAGAFLVKGFLAFVLPCIVIGPFLGWERRTGNLLRLAWAPLIAVVLVSAPWAILVHLREPGFWHHFIWTEHVSRFFAEEAEHREPFWHLLPAIAGGALPWAVLLPAAVLGIGRAGLRDPLLRFSTCWVVFPFLFFSASSGKLYAYILPCFPPLAILMALGLLRYLASGRRRALVAGVWALIALLLAGVVAFFIRQATESAHLLYARGEGWKMAVTALAAGVCVALAWLAARPRAAPRGLLLFAAAPVLLMAAVPFLLPKATQADRSLEAILARNAPRVEPGQPLVADPGTLHAVCWYYKRTNIPVLDPAGEARYGLSYDDAWQRGLRSAHLARLIAAWPSSTLVTFVAVLGRYEDEKGVLPKPEFEDIEGAFVVAQYRGGTPAPP